VIDDIVLESNDFSDSRKLLMTERRRHHARTLVPLRDHPAR
jgi:hypothetical protein